VADWLELRARRAAGCEDVFPTNSLEEELQWKCVTPPCKAIMNATKSRLEASAGNIQ